MSPTTQELRDGMVYRRPEGARMPLAAFVAAAPSVYVTVRPLKEHPRMRADHLTDTYIWGYASAQVEVRRDGVYWLDVLFMRQVLRFDQYVCATCNRHESAPRYEDLLGRNWRLDAFDLEAWEANGSYGTAYCADHAPL